MSFLFFFFFFKQKTAYVILISDWSSDVCSSDLSSFAFGGRFQASAVSRTGAIAAFAASINPRIAVSSFVCHDQLSFRTIVRRSCSNKRYTIGRASCRESVCQYVYISVVAVSLKNKKVKQVKDRSRTQKTI